jgi:hypothetical protein
MIDLTDKNLHRGIFASVPDLIASIEASLNAHNADLTPYVWTAAAEPILAKVQHHAPPKQLTKTETEY